MKIHRDVAQGSLEWSVLRSGKVTASEMDSLVSDTGKVRTGDGPRTYLTKKLAECWIGGPLPAVQGIWDMDQGTILETYARPAFTLETGMQVDTVGFITGDNPMLGCSPDGIVGDSLGLEIKAPHLERHIGYLLDGVCPKDYILQVQGSMFVTGFKEWIFCSYRRRMPLFVVRVQRDEKIQAAIAEAVDKFKVEFDKGMDRLVEINGGLPSRPVFTPPPPTPEPTERFDINN